jgi:hypothetical protein
VQSESQAAAPLAWQHTRMLDITARVLTAVGDPPTLTVIEGPAFGHGPQAGAHDMSGLWWRVVGHLLDAGVPVASVSPKTLKVYILGFAGSPKQPVRKADVRRAVEQRYRAYLTGGSHDVADAIGLAAMGARALGRPIDALPDTHLRAMTSVRWPAPPNGGDA